jgi:hypothetical protein
MSELPANDFWFLRDCVKEQITIAKESMEGIKKVVVLSDEEKIFLGQAIFWLKYLESRHYVSDEKFLKKFPKSWFAIKGYKGI